MKNNQARESGFVLVTPNFAKQFCRVANKRRKKGVGKREAGRTALHELKRMLGKPCNDLAMGGV
jgi:hypothetical protein